jgi:hypothetical protein
MGDGSRSQTPNKFEKGKSRTGHQDGEMLALDIVSAEEGAGVYSGGAFQQMQLVEQQVRHHAILVHVPDLKCAHAALFRIRIYNHARRL